MTPIKTQLYKKSYANELLRIAHGDLESALVLQEASRGRKENIGYLAQQCVEKCIKSVLCFISIPIPHSHEIAALIPLLPSDVSFPFGLEISDLSYYASLRRYTEGSYEVDNEEISTVLHVANSVYTWAAGIIS